MFISVDLFSGGVLIKTEGGVDLFSQALDGVGTEG
jgi:hypothetical protein